MTIPTIPLKAVQIGAGEFCRTFHGPTLQRLSQGHQPRVSLEAVCDLNLDRAREFCRSFGYSLAYDNFEKMIEETHPDVIYCMVQPTATAAVLEKVLSYRLPTFTEKPPGVTIDQAERLAQRAQELEVLNYVAFNRRRVPGLERLKHWAAANHPIRTVRVEMLRNRRLEADFGIGTAIHVLDYLRYLCGDATEVQTRHIAYAGTQATDFLIRLQFAGGLVADVSVLVDCGCRRERYLVHVEDSMMEVTVGAGYSSDFFPSGETVYKNDQECLKSPGERDPLVAGGFVGEHEAFLDSVQTGELPDCTLQDTYYSLRLAAAVQREFSGAMAEFTPG